MDGSWRVRVRVALDERARLRGLKPAATDHGLVLRGRSVHGLGMRSPLGLVTLDAAGTVVACAVLHPGTVVFGRSGSWIVELPLSVVPPADGTEMVLLRRILRG